MIVKYTESDGVIMGKGKIALRTIYNVMFFAFIFLMSTPCFISYSIVETAMFRTFLLPAMVLLLIYHIYTSVMYYIYCYKHKNDVICFINKDKSKIKSVVTVILLFAFTMLWILYALSLNFSFASDAHDSNKTAFLNKVDYSYVENVEISTEKSFTFDGQYSFLSMYATAGELITSETTTGEQVAEVSFEYGENLPEYVSSFIYNEIVDTLDTKWSYRVDGEDYSTTHNETEIDGVKIAYRYIQCSRANYINLCLKKGDKVLYISETWEQYVKIDEESRIDEWIEIFNNI